MNDDDAAFVEAMKLGARLARIHRELAEVDPDDHDELMLTERAKTEAELIEILDTHLEVVVEIAEAAAIDLQQMAVRQLGSTDHVLEILTMLAEAGEQVAALAGPGARVDYGSDLVEAARSDLRRVLVPLPIVELAEGADRGSQ